MLLMGNESKKRPERQKANDAATKKVEPSKNPPPRPAPPPAQPKK